MNIGMKHTCLAALAALLAVAFCASAQEAAPQDSAERVHVGGSLFTGVYSAWGETHAYTGVAPVITYRANDRLTLKAGFAVTTDLNASGYRVQGHRSPSYAPYRATTGATAVSVGAEYQVSDNLWVAARAFYLGGSYDPIWDWGQGDGPRPLSVYGGSVALHYRTPGDNSLSLYFNYLNDRTGALTPSMWGYPMGMGCCESPFMGGYPFAF